MSDAVPDRVFSVDDLSLLTCRCRDLEAEIEALIEERGRTLDALLQRLEKSGLEWSVSRDKTTVQARIMRGGDTLGEFFASIPAGSGCEEGVPASALKEAARKAGVDL